MEAIRGTPMTASMVAFINASMDAPIVVHARDHGRVLFHKVHTSMLRVWMDTWYTGHVMQTREASSRYTILTLTLQYE